MTRRESTLRIYFGADSRKPTDGEVFRFFRTQKWSSEDLMAMYREDRSVYVRFKSDELMENALLRLGAKSTFFYDDGTKLEVIISDASGKLDYIRIFGLPPEVEDLKIIEEMEKFGKIQQIFRERYAADTGYPIWNGVRGVLMEVEKEISSIVKIQSISARVYYNGIRNKCFLCGSNEHQKKDCKDNTESKKRLFSSISKNNSLFSSVVSNGFSALPSNDNNMVDLSLNDLGKSKLTLETSQNSKEENQLLAKNQHKRNSLSSSTNLDRAKDKGILDNDKKESDIVNDKTKTGNENKSKWTPEEIKRSWRYWQ